MPATPRDNIARLTPYVPGEQPAATDVVKLNTNENPYPPCDAVMQAVRDTPAELLRRYPPPRAARFREVAAKLHCVEPSQIIATNGGDELLRLIITAYCDAQAVSASGGVALEDPTYSLYEVLAAIQGAAVVRFERGEQFELPDRFAQRASAAGARVLFTVNPHAPSGRMTSVETLRELAAAFDGLVVIDEAYANFADADALPLVRQGELHCDNVILLRTLSKGYSLAGLRFGYGVASPAIVETLDKIRDSYNLDALAQRAAIAALEHADEAAKTWARVRDERDRLAAALRELGFHVPQSSSNFLLTTVPGARAEALYQFLADRHIFVRYFNHPRLADKLRISIGTPEQSDRLLASVREWLNQGTAS